MKQGLILIIVGVLTFNLVSQVRAANEASSAAETNQNLEKVRQLKEKVAEKVAQLKGEELRVYQGEISDISEELITIIGKKSLQLRIQTNSQTKFTWLNTDGKKLNISFKDLTKGDFITAWGEANKETGLLTAKVISGRLPPIFFSCQVTRLDLSKKTLSCQDKIKAKTYDLVITDKTNVYLNLGKTKAEVVGWEKITIGAKILGKTIKKNPPKDLLTALLILVFKPSTVN